MAPALTAGGGLDLLPAPGLKSKLPKVDCASEVDAPLRGPLLFLALEGKCDDVGEAKTSCSSSSSSRDMLALPLALAVFELKGLLPGKLCSAMPVPFLVGCC